MVPVLLKRLTEDEYLAAELHATVRHEFLHGAVYAMAGGSANHNRIAGGLYARMLAAQTADCQPLSAK